MVNKLNFWIFSFTFSGLIGLAIYFVLPVFSYFQTPANLLAPSLPVTDSTVNWISIPKFNKSLPVWPAQVNQNSWEVFETAVAWYSDSALPGEGNTILYAHNSSDLFGNLQNLQINDRVLVGYKGFTYIYQVSQTRSISPDYVEAVIAEGTRLTLYTCEGSFDQKRRVVYAELIDVVDSNYIFPQPS